MISKEYLEQERKSLEAQRDNAFAVMQQAIGAISLIDSLEKKIEPSMTISELTEAIERGAPSGASHKE